MIGIRPTEAVPPSQEAAGSFEEIVRLAAAARDGGRVDEAVESYRRALRLQRDWEEGWWWLGVLLYEQDQFAEAVKAFRVVTDLNPRIGNPWLMIGLCQYGAHDYYRALESFNRSLTLGLGGNDTLRFTGNLHKAQLLTRFEEYEVAFGILWLLAKNHSSDPKVVTALGICVLRLPFVPHEVPLSLRDAVLTAGRAFAAASQEDVETANGVFETLIKDNPETPNTHYAYGQFLRLRDAERAESMFQKELSISPNHVPARLQLAYLKMSQGQYEDARPFVEEALRIQSDSASAHYVLGMVYLGLRDFEKAISPLEKAVEAFPGSTRARTSLAQAYFRSGRQKDAEVQLAEVGRLQSLQQELEQGLITSGQIEEPQEPQR